MIASPELSKLLVCTVLLAGGFSWSNETHEELAQAWAEREVAPGEEAKAPLPEPRQPAKITFAIHGYEGVNEAREFGPLKAEIEKRGFPGMIVRSPRTKTKTPHQDRAKVMVQALKGVEGDIVLVGISNQGMFMPLVAAERPIRRIVMINAVVPTPGKSFREAFNFKEVFANEAMAQLAELAPGMSEVCPLKELPKVEYVWVCGEKDDAVRPEWQQRIAREYLHVEPVIVRDAGHANIVTKYTKELVDAATKGLGRIEMPCRRDLEIGAVYAHRPATLPRREELPDRPADVLTECGRVADMEVANRAIGTDQDQGWEGLDAIFLPQVPAGPQDGVFQSHGCPIGNSLDERGTRTEHDHRRPSGLPAAPSAARPCYGFPFSARTSGFGA